jgi:hypothetical protein
MPGSGDEERARETKRRRREFIRAHHPDRGGDTERFIAGLRVFDAGQAPAEPPPLVVIVRHRPWLTRLVLAAVRLFRHDSKPARVR